MFRFLSTCIPCSPDTATTLPLTVACLFAGLASRRLAQVFVRVVGLLYCWEVVTCFMLELLTQFDNYNDVVMGITKLN